MPQLIAEAVEEKRALLATSGYRALPGAVSAVRRLSRGRSKLAVVTGRQHARRRTTRWRASALTDSSRVLVAAEDYPRGKPAPEPYAPGDRAPGRRRAARSIAIEDATPGILSARAAGARVIAVRAGNFAGYDLSPADVVVDTLDDVTDDADARGCCREGRSRDALGRRRLLLAGGDHPAAADRLDVDAQRGRLGEPGAVLVLHGRVVGSAHLPHLRGAPEAAAGRDAPAEGHLAQHRAHRASTSSTSSTTRWGSR